MKVKELLAQLQKVDPNLYVVCYAESEDEQDGGPVVHIFEIDTVSVAEAEMSRSEDGHVQLKFERSNESTKLACINVLVDF